MGSPRVLLNHTGRRASLSLLEGSMVSLWKDGVINLETTESFIPWCESNSLQSQTYLFIFPFSSPAPSTEAHYEIMESHFLSKGSWLPRVTRALSVPRVILLTEAITGGRGWEKEGEAGRTKSSRDGSLLSLLGCCLWGPRVSYRPGMEYELVWGKGGWGKWGK